MHKINRINQSKLKEHGDYDITDMIQFEKVDIGKFILRLSIGGLMLFHGLHKVFYGTEMVDKVLASVGLPVFFSAGVFIGEVIAPIMLILGFKVRLGGFLIAANMFVATLLVHSADFFSMTDFGGWMLELNALYFLGGLSIMFLGSGHYALTKGRGALD